MQQRGMGNAAIVAGGGKGGAAPGAGNGFGQAQRGVGNAAISAAKAGEQHGGGGGGAAAPSAPGAAATGEGKDAAVTAKEPVATGGDAITILGTALPTQSARALVAAKSSAESELASERDALAENPPAMEAPSGLAPTAQEGDGEEAPSAARAETAPGIADQPVAGSPPPPLDTHHEAATGPVPVGPPTAGAIDSAPADPAARAQTFERLMSTMPTEDASIDTSAGPPPKIELSADADPARFASQEAANEVILGGQDAVAAQEMQADEGVDAIYPTLPDEMLTAPVGTGAGQGIPELQPGEMAPLDADVTAALDQGAAGEWGAATADAEAKHSQAVLDKQQGEVDARADTERKTLELEQATAEEQRGYRAAAHEDVNKARTAWRGEIDAARETYDDERATVRKDLDRDVSAEVALAEGEAAAHLAQGEADAERRRIEGEKEAADTRSAAERERDQADGFFDWVASKVKSFFSALQAALKAVFTALRKAVTLIIEGAKKLASAAIELGRRAVVGLIKVAGAALELAADVFLAAFPEARDRAKAAIRRGVEIAEDAVNRAAELLRQGVCALLDLLGKALIAILDVYEAIYSAILKAVEFLVVGMIEISRGLYRLGLAARSAPGELEGQIYEEMLGADLTQPLPFELTAAELAQLSAGPAAEGAEGVPQMGDDAPTFAEGPAPTEVEMDQVPELDLDPELESELPDGDGGEIVFGENNDPDNSLAALHAELGYAPAAEAEPEALEAQTPAPMEGAAASEVAPREKTTDERLDEMIAQEPDHNCDTEAPTNQQGPAIPLEAKFGPLTKTQRARYMMAQAWKGIKQWLSCNWGKLLLGILAAIVAIALLIVAIVVSGGSVAAVLGTMLAWFSGAMIVYAIARVGGFLLDYLQKSWGGDIAGGAKGLARAIAIGAVEIIFAVLTYLTAGAFRILSTTVKAVGRATATAAKGAAKLIGKGIKATGKFIGRGIKATGKLLGKGVSKLGRAGGYVVRQGKIVMKGIGRGVSRGAKSLKDFGKRLGGKLRFKRFKIVFKGRRFQLWGQINPWVLLANGKLKKDNSVSGAVGSKVAVKGSTKPALIVGVSKKGGKAFKGARVKQLEGMSDAGRKRLAKALAGSTDDEAKAVLASEKKIADAAAKAKPGYVDPHKGKSFTTSSGKTGKIGDTPIMSKTKKGKPQVTDIDGAKTTLRRPKKGFKATKNPDGSTTYKKGTRSLDYDADGFPKFQHKGEAHIDPKHIGSGNDAAHFKAANGELAKQLVADPSLAGKLGLTPAQVTHIKSGSKLPPPGLTWHHHQNTGLMQLIDKKTHDFFRHTGGMRIWGGGH